MSETLDGQVDLSQQNPIYIEIYGKKIQEKRFNIF